MLSKLKRYLRSTSSSNNTIKPVSFDLEWLNAQPALSPERSRYIEEITRKAFLAVSKD